MTTYNKDGAFGVEWMWQCNANEEKETLTLTKWWHLVLLSERMREECLSLYSIIRLHKFTSEELCRR